jgi:secreted trypsin-like serine protease
MAACCWALPAAALLTRPDRDDAEYLELATRYSSCVPLNAPAGGEGVLIASRWVLTAAHMAKTVGDIKPPPVIDAPTYSTPKPKAAIAVGSRYYEVEKVFIHPDWKQDGDDSDIALILLKTAVPDVKPTPAYKDQDEQGKTVVIVGHGLTGKIGSKPQPKAQWDRKQRAGINTIDRVGAITLGMRIKAADEASDLQAAAAPGDSGAPAFIETPEGLFVAGIGYATEDNGDGIIGNAGDWETYARVSAFYSWIEKTMLGVAREDAEKLLGGTK